MNPARGARRRWPVSSAAALDVRLAIRAKGVTARLVEPDRWVGCGFPTGRFRGSWLFDCDVTDHIRAGMLTR